MSKQIHPLIRLLQEDRRYTIEAYQFVREALDYGQNPEGVAGRKASLQTRPKPGESHLTGQQLCEAVRRFAIEQYGFMAKVVLNSWGIQSTSDLGEIVYNLIRILEMKKSDSDNREDFDNVYDFDDAFVREFEFQAEE